MKIGIIGGPFYWNIWELETKKIVVETPYGMPADGLFKGKIGDHEIITLLRHGSECQYNNAGIPYLANVYALGLQKLDFVIHVTLCGSLNKEHSMGDIFLFDQLIDQTRKRPDTFGMPLFDKVHHIDFSCPISKQLITIAHTLFSKYGIKHQCTGTMLTEEGPRFSTAAETKMYRMMGADAINQTSCPEVYLLRELGLPVVAMCLVTNIVDLDFLIESEEVVDSVSQFRHVIPSAIKTFIEHMSDDMEILKPKINEYDTSKFDLRGACKVIGVLE